MHPTQTQAVLTAKGGDSVFKVVETNDFKQLPHITLTFRPGNDTAVKQARARPPAPACARPRPLRPGRAIRGALAAAGVAGVARARPAARRRSPL